MKKLLFVLVIGAFAACGSGASTEGTETKDTTAVSAPAPDTTLAAPAIDTTKKDTLKK